jgi:hypothetical protein
LGSYLKRLREVGNAAFHGVGQRLRQHRNGRKWWLCAAAQTLVPDKAGFFRPQMHADARG